MHANVNVLRPKDSVYWEKKVYMEARPDRFKTFFFMKTKVNLVFIVRVMGLKKERMEK